MLYGQKVLFKSSDDSTNINVTLTTYKDNKHLIIKSIKSEIDFSSFIDNQLVEIQSNGYENLYFSYTSQIPSIIYLHKLATNFNETIVTGQMQQTSISDAVQNVKIINAKKIEQMGAQNLTQLFKNELNIQLSNDAILGSGMDLQGISGENVKILIDGVPVIGKLNGTVDLDQINLQNVEKIEIIEGPLSVNYGADALAGTINIITKKNQSNLLSGKLYGYYESNGTYNAQVNLTTKFKNTLLAMDVNRNYFDGWRPDEKPFHIEKVRIADSLRNKTFKPREQYFGGFKINQRLNSTKHDNGLYLTVDFRLFKELIENRGKPLKPYFVRAFDDYYNTFRSDNSLSLNGRIANKWSINSTNAYNFYKRTKNTYINDLTTLEKKLSAPSEQDTSAFDLILSRTSFIYSHSTKWHLEVGYDINYESSRGKRINGKTEAIGDYALYITSEYTAWNKLTIKPGIRASYNSVYKSPIVPSLFLKYAINKNNSIRASYSRGFRAPSIKELFFYFVDINHNIIGNKDLKAETSNNYQLSVRTEYQIKNFRFVINNQFFFNDLKNLITLAQKNSTEYSYVNLFKAQTYGYTLNTNFLYNDLSIDAGVSIKARKNQIIDSIPARATSFYPEIKFNPSYTVKKINTTFALFYKFTGKLPNLILKTDGSVIEAKRDPYHMMDFTITTHFYKKIFALTIGAKNLLNVTSINGMTGSDGAHSSGASNVQIGMGRTYFCSLTINLNTKK
ncbi:MAG: TonB-dependent receptor [Crocinitomicaceae bacterium]|nr:TonB-dependent receptor [Crocinitomicaceae bacterium]